MGVTHSMNEAQVSEVLDQFEATADAIQGIENKVSVARVYFQNGQQQQEKLVKKAEVLAKVMNNLNDTLTQNTEAILEFMFEMLDNFAGHTEALEKAIHDIGFSSVLWKMETDFLLMIVPALVLVVIITGSNCVFGYLLASDTRMSGPTSLETGQKESFDNLLLFSIFHMSVIGMFVLYLVIEVLRYVCRPKKKPRNDDWLEEDDEEDDEFEVDVTQDKHTDINDMRRHNDELVMQGVMNCDGANPELDAGSRDLAQADNISEVCSSSGSSLGVSSHNVPSSSRQRRESKNTAMQSAASKNKKKELHPISNMLSGTAKSGRTFAAAKNLCVVASVEPKTENASPEPSAVPVGLPSSSSGPASSRS